MSKQVPGLTFAILVLWTAATPPSWSEPSALALPASLDGQIRKGLMDNPFGEPLYVQSKEHQGLLDVDIYAVLGHPFARVSQALATPASWCEFMSLHPSVQACRYRDAGGNTWLIFDLDSQNAEPSGDPYTWSYRYRIAQRNPQYVKIELDAESGPLGARNFRVELEATPLQKYVLFRVHASYEPSLLSKVITGAYFNTFAYNRIGFSVLRRDAAGEPVYMRGRKALLERTVMRCHLAFIAFLDTAHLPITEQFEARANRWLDLTEKYATQLGRIDRGNYLQAKRRERRP